MDGNRKMGTRVVLAFALDEGWALLASACYASWLFFSVGTRSTRPGLLMEKGKRKKKASLFIGFFLIIFFKSGAVFGGHGYFLMACCMRKLGWVYGGIEGAAGRGSTSSINGINDHYVSI